MSGFLIILIAILYIMIAGVIFGLYYKITKDDDIFCYMASFFWPVLIIAIPIGLLVYWIVEHINIK